MSADTFSERLAVTTPAEWHVISNDGTTIVAVNKITNQTFNGLRSTFNTLRSVDATKDSLRTEPLGIPSVARQLAFNANSVNLVLTPNCARVSIMAVGAAARYMVGSDPQTATATSHYLADGERIDIRLPLSPNIAVMRAGGANGVLEITELV